MIIILLFVVISLVKILLSLPFISPYIMMDEVYYDNVAQNILHGKLYASFISQLGTTPPGYSIFLSVAYLFSQDKSVIYHVMLAINAFLTTSIIFPSYFILKKYCTPVVSILGALLVATLPIVNLYTYLLMSEDLFIPLFVFSLWFVIESFETNNPVWEFLASFSVVFLYMTRSTGIAMLVGFVAAFAYYAIVNRKQKSFIEIVKEKKVLLLSFVILLSLWLLYTVYCIPQGSYSIGSPYKVESRYTNRIISAFSQFEIFKDYIISFIREMDYLILSTYFALIFVLYYYVRSFVKRDRTNAPLYISFIYFIVCSIGLLAISTTFMSYSYTKLSYEIYGRYIEAIIPPIFIFTVVGISRFIKEDYTNYKKWIIPLLIYIPVILFALFTIPLKNYNIVNTLSIYYLYVIYNPGLSYVLLTLLALSLFLMLYLIFIDKRYYYVILLSLICISLIFSAPAYRSELMCSTYSGDDIVNYLKNNSNMDTAVLIDKTTYNGIGWYTGSEVFFWSNGSVFLTMDVLNESTSSMYRNKTIYIISHNDYPYKIMANGSMGVKLYKNMQN